jgi:hypothetical protein
MERSRTWFGKARCAVAAAAFALAPAPGRVAHARIVQPGQTLDPVSDPLTGVSLAERPELAGQIILDVTAPFDNGDLFQGTIRTQVVREDVGGTLDFYYDISPSIEEFLVTGFDRFLTDVDGREDLGSGAEGVGRSADGDTLQFIFSAGGPTFVKTDATAFALRGTLIAIPDGSGGPATATVPVPVPLPPALLAAPAALLLAGYAGKRLRRRPA